MKESIDTLLDKYGDNPNNDKVYEQILQKFRDLEITATKRTGAFEACKGALKRRLAKIKELKAENDELKDFCIWLTGCGYDFCKHEYFIKQRDKLLKNYEVGPFKGEE